MVREEGDKRLVRERRDTVQPYKRIRGGDPPHTLAANSRSPWSGDPPHRIRDSGQEELQPLAAPLFL